MHFKAHLNILYGNKYERYAAAESLKIFLQQFWFVALICRQTVHKRWWLGQNTISTQYLHNVHKAAFVSPLCSQCVDRAADAIAH